MKKLQLFSYLLLFGTLTNAQYSDISFNNTNGKTPYGNVIISGTKLYGMTSAGGSNGVGCIYSIGTNGSGYLDLHDFTLMTGETPHGTLLLSTTGDSLFGMTNQGGTGSDGVIFSITTTGSNYTVLHNFNGTAGKNPMGALILNGKTLYGMTATGGANSDGCIFSITVTGGSYADIYDFNGTAGSVPHGSLTFSVTKDSLFGTTTGGGANSDGVIFSVTTTGSYYTDLHDFNSTAGKTPQGSLILSGKTLYGMASAGGANSDGCIYSITVTGGSYNDLYDFTGTYGSVPIGDLLLSNGVFFGLTSTGGANSDGDLFSLHKDGTEFSDLYDFNSTHGATPYGSVILSSGILYGMTTSGGSSSDGVIFNYTICNTSASTSVATNVSCNGGSNGSASVSGSGASSLPFSYSWSNGQTNATATGLTAGTYTATVTDFYSCSATATVSITQPITLSVTASAKNSAVCPGSSDSLFSTPSGGTSPYTYAWNPAPFADMSCSSCQKTQCYPFGTTFTITVTDKNGCTATASVNVTIHPFPYVTITGPINPIAPGRSDTLIASAVGATYLWSNSSTTSSIIVSPSVSTTYSVTATNTYGCYDTAHYTIDTNSVGNGRSSSSPIRIVPSSSVTMQSFSTLDSVVWFSFVPTDSNNQIIANSAFLGYPVPHVHRLTLYNSSLGMIVDEPMPDIQGANQIRIDISHLAIGSTYYLCASRAPAHANMPGCNPTGDICNKSQRWSFQMAFRTVPVFVPDDSDAEAPGINQLYYECRGQIVDINQIPRFDIKAYTTNASPAVYASDSAVSFVYSRMDTIFTKIDTVQRVDMILTGTGVQPSQPVFKMQEDSGAGYLNYIRGSIPDGVYKVEGYSRLVYKNVYSNVDMHVYSNTAGTKFYFVCNPAGGGVGAGNPASIELEFKGANSVSVTGGGSLEVATDFGNLSFAPGYAYTDSTGIVKPKSWQAYFVAVNSNTVKFNTGSYNTSEPLVIEVDRGHLSPPVPPYYNLLWSTYCGGSNDDCFYALANDAVGSNTIATGYTLSSNFPVSSGAYKGTLGATGITNAVIASFNSNNVRNWSTFFGGKIATDEDYGRAVTVDISSNVYVTGSTMSSDFPHLIPSGAFNNPGGYNGTPYDAFVTELNEAGALVWSTYFGGVGSQVGLGIAVDASKNLYVVGGQEGYVTSSAIPTYTVSGAFNSTSGTGWMAKFNSSHAIVWATDIGGNNGANSVDDKLYGCSLDPSGSHLYVTGDVQESGFPVNGPSPILSFTPGAQANAVVAQINCSSLAMDWATYYGGDGYDRGIAIVASPQDGNVYITGETSSPVTSVSIPISTNCCGYPTYQATLGGTGQTNAYIAGFSQSSGAMVYGTYFGGNAIIFGQGIAWNNGLYITGLSYSGGLPTPAGNPSNTWNVTSIPGTQVNTFVACFPYSLTNATHRLTYNWGTYFGGNGSDNAFAAMTTNTDLFIAGCTTSSQSGSNKFPLDYSGTPTPWYQPTYNGGPIEGDAFISEFLLAPTLVGAGINDIINSENEITIYPNPTSQDITVQMESESEQDMLFTIFNLLGEPVYCNTFKELSGMINQKISLSLLPSGIYILQVKAGENIYHSKIIKLQ